MRPFQWYDVRCPCHPQPTPDADEVRHDHADPPRSAGAEKVHCRIGKGFEGEQGELAGCAEVAAQRVLGEHGRLTLLVGAK